MTWGRKVGGSRAQSRYGTLSLKRGVVQSQGKNNITPRGKEWGVVKGSRREGQTGPNCDGNRGEKWDRKERGCSLEKASFVRTSNHRVQLNFIK